MTVDDIRNAMIVAGSHWWDRDTMRFFGTRVYNSVLQGPSGVFFITSEQPPYSGRKYTLRQFHPSTAKIETVGTFCGYTNLKKAKQALDKIKGNSNAYKSEDRINRRAVTA